MELPDEAAGADDAEEAAAIFANDLHSSFLMGAAAALPLTCGGRSVTIGVAVEAFRTWQ